MQFFLVKRSNKNFINYGVFNLPQNEMCEFGEKEEIYQNVKKQNEST